MKILELQLCNFKNYRGLHSMDFSTRSPSHPIILIGGMNGAGKTTIFEAVKLCLFGIQYQGQALPKKRYDSFIRDARNKYSVLEKDSRYFVQVSLLLEDVFPTYSITLKRSWSLDEHGRVNESFSIMRDNIPLEIVSQEYWQDYISSLVPPYITDYFFFDGERLAELTSGDNAEEILRDAARDLIGLKQYETLKGDLDTLEKKIKRKSIKNKATVERIQELDSKVKLNNSLIQENIRIIADLSGEIKDKEHNIENIEDELQRKAGSIAKERQTIGEELALAKERVNSLTDEIAEVCNYTSFVLAKPLVERTIEALKAEKEIKENTNSNRIVEQAESRVFQRLESFKPILKDDMYNRVIEEVRAEFSSLKDERLNCSNATLIHDVTNETFLKIEEIFSQVEEKGRIQLKDKLIERQNLDLAMKRYQSQLKTIPDDSIVKDELQKILQIKDDISNNKVALSTLENEQFSLTSETKIIREELEKIEISGLKAEEDFRKISLCERMQETLDEYMEYMLASRVQELEQLVMEMHSRLENKNDLIASLKINPITLEIFLFDRDRKEVKKELLSAGEKEILSLSILWALSRIGKTTMPIIVDSLLARLDADHVDKVATRFLPQAGSQVIILSHDREVDEELYRKLLPCISQSYLLSYSESNKISKGYFFGGA
ncbi:hypothetical protein AZH53_09780 [Methanomicrobiaceae archaeon CYW5]|uniref:DNA sulfur modification protein DndD n=1 Tax=Methanovulcanius yangii TaxID=1789227 RepID=UPI0029CA1EB3|nr:DNA sulfur modification protein DndD [Methanovulcanius yangii]MBT8508693.1 hypothetical protein [Methanovulcanius yangii]